MGFSLYFMNLTRDGVADADRAGIAKFLKGRNLNLAPGGDDAPLIAPGALDFEGHTSDLHVDSLNGEAAVTGGVWHAALTAPECDFIFGLCRAGNMMIVNPQGPPMVLVPGPIRDAESLPSWCDLGDIVPVESGEQLRELLSWGFGHFETYRDRVLGHEPEPCQQLVHRAAARVKS